MAIGDLGSSAPVAFTVAATAPYVFTWGNYHGWIFNADQSQNTPTDQATAGSSIVVLLTGQGAVNPHVHTGYPGPSNPPSKVVATTTATIDGSPATVSSSILAPGQVGLCHVTVEVPAGLPVGEHKLVVNIGGVNSNEVLFDSGSAVAGSFVPEKRHPQ